MTLETLTRTAAADDGTSLPTSLRPFSSHVWFAYAQGSASYAGIFGSVDVGWLQLLGPYAMGYREYAADVSQPAGEWQCTILRQPPAASPPPVVRQPTPVAPTPQGQPTTNVIVTSLERDQRRRIVASARAELALWDQQADEDGRLPLRLKYLDVAAEASREANKKLVASHTNSSQHWCGVFGIWNVQQIRNDGVQWNFGQRPSNVLYCTDRAKLHTGDVALVGDPPEVVAARRAWQAKFDAAYAAVKAANPTWTAAQIAVEAEKLSAPKAPAPLNHHVLVTDIGQDPVEIVQGNSGSPPVPREGFYPSYSLVTAGKLARSRIAAFYCSCPDPKCMDKAKKTNNYVCPEANGKPCILPDT
jgi:hypothetical protein